MDPATKRRRGSDWAFVSLTSLSPCSQGQQSLCGRRGVPCNVALTHLPGDGRYEVRSSALRDSHCSAQPGPRKPD